jgi:tetratricopeptide (TPR) repeat protein
MLRRLTMFPLIWALLPSLASANAVPPMATVGGAQAARSHVGTPATTAAPASISKSAVVHWHYALKDAVVTQTGADGKTTNSLDLPVVDDLLQTVAEYAGDYPPHFDNAAERADVTDKLTRLIIALSSADTGASVNLELLRREAFAFNLGCNLHLRESCEKTAESYQRLLAMTPDDPAANYLYGIFLGGTASRQGEAVPYLEKAGKLGVKQANFTLATIYLMQGHKQQALSHMQAYSADFPNDAGAKKFIAALQSGKAPGAATH